MAAAAGLGPVVRKDVRVRLPSPAPRSPESPPPVTSWPKQRHVARSDATLTWAANVTDEESVAGLMAGIQSQFGRLDAVVTCAGVIDIAPVSQMSKEQWERVVSVNLTGTFLVIRDCLPPIRQSDRGRIICISSDAGNTIPGEPGIAHYYAFKFGAIGSSPRSQWGAHVTPTMSPTWFRSCRWNP